MSHESLLPSQPLFAAFSKMMPPPRLSLLAVVVSLTVAGCDRALDVQPDAADALPLLNEAQRSPLAADLAAEIEVLAKVVVRSPLVDPARSDYKDCLFTAELSILKPLAGPKTRRQVVVFFPGFLNRKPQPEAAIKLGDTVRCRLLPLEGAPARIRDLQRCDVVADFLLDRYFAAATARVENSVAAAEKPDPAWFLPDPDAAAAATPANRAYPHSASAVAARKADIARHVREIDGQLAANGGSWEAWRQRLKPFHDDLAAQAKNAPDKRLRSGRHHFRRLEEEPYHALCEDAEAGRPGPVAMLSHLNSQLALRGVHLVVMPIPHKEEVHADEFSERAPADGVFVAGRQRLLRQLLERNVEVIDLVPALRAARQEFEWLFFDADDHHPLNGAVEVAAREAARRLERYGFPMLHGYQKLSSTARRDEIVIGPDAKGLRAGARYPATVVEMAGGGGFMRAGRQLASPLVLMGDSVTLSPMEFGDTANLRAHLAHATGVIPDHLTSMGGSAQAMRHLAREGAHFLADRAVLIFTFAPARLFGSVSSLGEGQGWDLVNLPPLVLD